MTVKMFNPVMVTSVASSLALLRFPRDVYYDYNLYCGEQSWRHNRHTTTSLGLLTTTKIVIISVSLYHLLSSSRNLDHQCDAYQEGITGELQLRYISNELKFYSVWFLLV